MSWIDSQSRARCHCALNSIGKIIQESRPDDLAKGPWSEVNHTVEIDEIAGTIYSVFCSVTMYSISKPFTLYHVRIFTTIMTNGLYFAQFVKGSGN